MTHRATCQTCGASITDSTESWVRAAADAHADECTETAPDETADVVVEEVVSA